MARLHRVLGTLALLVAAVALTAAPAAAHKRHHHRSHTDAHHGKDRDRDGLKDGVERRFGFDPRDRDSDDDGILDGKENAGKVKRLSGTSITIKLAAGGRLRAELGCPQAPAAAPDPATGEDDPSGDDESDDTPDDPTGEDDDPADDPADDGPLDEGRATAAQDEADAPACDMDGLRKGARVHEATVDRSSGRPVITALTLVRR
jgi:hypothetical protein